MDGFEGVEISEGARRKLSFEELGAGLTPGGRGVLKPG